MLFVFTVIQLSLVFITYYSETRMARETARWLAVHATTTDDNAVATHVQNTMLPGLINTSGSPSVTYGTYNTPATAVVGNMTVTYTPCEWSGGPVCHYPSSGTPSQGDGRAPGTVLYVTMSYDARNVMFLPTTFRLGFLTISLPTTLPSYTIWVMVE